MTARVLNHEKSLQIIRKQSRFLSSCIYFHPFPRVTRDTLEFFFFDSERIE